MTEQTHIVSAIAAVCHGAQAGGRGFAGSQRSPGASSARTHRRTQSRQRSTPARNRSTELYNYRVLTADGGKEGRRDEVRCVLMDLLMPFMDGLAAISLLQRLNPNIYAIAMSSLNSTEAVAEADCQCFQGFLAKPFTIQELLKAVRQSTASTAPYQSNA
jgi:CheY-like chemotaxis protein